MIDIMTRDTLLTMGIIIFICILLLLFYRAKCKVREKYYREFMNRRARRACMPHHDDCDYGDIRSYSSRDRGRS